MSDQYETTEELASYGLGRQVGEQLLSQPFPGMNPQALLDGIADSLEGVSSPYNDDQIIGAMNEIQQRMNDMQRKQANAMAAEGERFLAENAKRDEVTVTGSGLQYEVLQQGTGAKPAANARVKVHYHGTLIDGSVFDSSVQRGEPIELPLDGVIRGWAEGLQLMQEGARYKLYVPHDLGYGERGAGGQIAPFSTLIFEVELLSILS